MKHFVFFIILFLFQFSAFGQIANDCENAIVFQNSVYGPLNIPKGYGKKLEISGHNIKNEQFFTREHNTLWIKINFIRDTKFVFELQPEHESDDYDFIIFRINGDNYCDSISLGTAKPIRSNLCKNKPLEKSITGLKEGYENNFAAAGNSPSFSAPLNVKAGESYFLVIDNPYGAKGSFNVALEYENEPIVIEEPVVEPEKPQYHTIYAQFMNENGITVQRPNVLVKGLKKGDRIAKDSNAISISPAHQMNSYLFIVTQRGFKQTTFSYFHRYDSDTTLTFQLEKLKKGTKLQFENINFVGDEAAILPDSEEDLDKLLNFLSENKNISVEVGGHVNAPGSRNTKKFLSLSEERAKAVYDYLISNGIEASRLTFVGYGNSKMIFPAAASEEQAKANRRVELIVTSIQ